MKVMIFGGAGFIGSHLSEFFLDAGHQVVVVDNLITGNMPRVKYDLEFYDLDISNQSAKWNSLPTDIDIIYHLAFPTSLCKRDYSSQYIDCCTLGMYNVMEFCQRTCGNIIYGSSISVYGEPSKFPITEKNEVMPILYYGAHKFLNEQYLNIYTQSKKINFEIVRIADVFGEGDKRKNAITNFIDGISKGLAITINGDGNQIRTFTYVRDVAYALCEFSKKPLSNDIYNLVGSEYSSISNLADEISRELQTKPRIHLNKSQMDRRNYIFDNSKLISRIGQFEKIGFREGLKQTIKLMARS